VKSARRFFFEILLFSFIVVALVSPGGRAIIGSRNASMKLLADAVQTYGSLSGAFHRPVFDRTGLKGTFDYTIEWTGRLGPSPAGTDAPGAVNRQSDSAWRRVARA
jgi:uncharacterized protein (TIGR03435 family)